MSNSELWKPKRSKLQEKWKVFDFEVKKNWTPRGRLEPNNQVTADEQGALSEIASPQDCMHWAMKVSILPGVCASEHMSLSSSSSDTEVERMCEDQSLSTEGDVWNLPATDEGRAGARHDPVAAASKETLVTRQELMLIGEKPGVEAIEAVCTTVTDDMKRREECDETVFEVWQPKFFPRDLLDLNELDICLSVYNEAVLECLQSIPDTCKSQQMVLLKHWKLTTKHVLSVISDGYMMQRLQRKREMEKALQCHLQSDLLSTQEEIRSALGSYYTVLRQVQACKKEEGDRQDTEEMLKELRQLAKKYHI